MGNEMVIYWRSEKLIDELNLALLLCSHNLNINRVLIHKYFLNRNLS